MSKIKIITDSTSYIEEEYAKTNGLSIVPLNFSFNDEVEKEGLPGEFEDFFERLKNSKEFPTTSQPSTGEFVLEFEKAFEEGFENIIVILLSSKLSGTFNSAVLAKEILDDESITIIDSGQTVSNLRFLIEDAIDMVAKGSNVEEIVDHIESKKHNISAFVTVDSLEYLKKGGRLSGLQSAIGSVLNIKPIIQLKDGELELLEKIRGKNKAVQNIIKKLPNDVTRISVCHILNESEAIVLRDKVKDKYPSAKITIDELGPVIGCHLGPKAIGLCFY